MKTKHRKNLIVYNPITPTIFDSSETHIHKRLRSSPACKINSTTHKLVNASLVESTHNTLGTLFKYEKSYICKTVSCRSEIKSQYNNIPVKNLEKQTH